ncbi:MAG: hypothetical protein ACK5P5_09975 [Pseudobdellovibrionaceae bacterium]
MFEFQLKHMIPSLYQTILPQEILNLAIKETTANCNNCVMAKENVSSKEIHIKKSSPSMKPQFRNLKTEYKSNLKCCTFHPFFPNYIVGAILADQNKKNEFGKTEIKRRIQSKNEILPLGIAAPRNYQLDFLKNPSKFGQKENLLCPFFDSKSNQCGFWIYRGSVCTSFFCASDHSWGFKFWDELVSYLSLVEISLAELALEKMGFSGRDGMLGFDLIDLGKLEKSDRAKISMTEKKSVQSNAFWKTYKTPENFYLECHRQVILMSQKDLDSALGNILQNQKKKVLSNFKADKSK